jgi:hypothetical protein
LIATAACRHDPPAPRKAIAGRSWTTPPIEAADGGLIAQRLPRVVNRGGPFIRNPRIVTITFTRDEPQVVAKVEQFGDTITQTSWWREVVDSYCAKPDDCIGEAQPGPHVRLGDALPSSMQEIDVDKLLEREAKAGRFGPLDPNTLLLLYLPKGVTLEGLSSKYCAGGPRAFHRSIEVENQNVAFAALPRCGDEAELTATASHELVEAVTNPNPSSRGFAFERSSANLGFLAAGLEPVDPCGLITMDSHWIPEAGFVVQQAWSNRAAALGRDPCVPSRPDRPYLALVPRESTVRLNKEGASATIALDARSDRPVPKWAISALDLTGYRDHAEYVDLSLDKSTIESGQSATLTITVRMLGKSETVVGAVSTLGVTSHMWPIAIVMR